MRLPNRALTTSDLERLCRQADIIAFNGVRMRDNIPSTPPKRLECSIINMASTDDGTNGTHWTAYWLNGKNVYYFDSYGHLEPPLEWKRYFGAHRTVLYNTNHFQTMEKDSVICGHLCFLFLWTMSEQYKKSLLK